MKEALDEMPGLHIVPLESRAELKKNREEIGDWMRNDALTGTFDPTGPSYERKETVKKLEAGLRHSELHSGEHELVLVAKEGEKIVGFLAVKMTDTGKKAEVTQLSTKFEDRSHRTVVAKLLLHAKHSLEAMEFRHLDVSSSGDAVAAASRRSELQYFLRVHKPESPEAKAEEPERGRAGENLESGY